LSEHNRARRALEQNGITSLEKLASFSEKEILQLHGMGKKTMPILKKTLADKRLSFRK
jgi:DNA-directed RNA polymerase alpha subunit